MSLDKSIKSGKERRKSYRGSKSFDSSCRTGGSCGWCRSNRMKKNKVNDIDCKQQLKDLKEG